MFIITLVTFWSSSSIVNFHVKSNVTLIHVFLYTSRVFVVVVAFYLFVCLFCFVFVFGFCQVILIQDFDDLTVTFL